HDGVIAREDQPLAPYTVIDAEAVENGYQEGSPLVPCDLQHFAIVARQQVLERTQIEGLNGRNRGQLARLDVHLHACLELANLPPSCWRVDTMVRGQLDSLAIVQSDFEHLSLSIAYQLTGPELGLRAGEYIIHCDLQLLASLDPSVGIVRSDESEVGVESHCSCPTGTVWRQWLFTTRIGGADVLAPPVVVHLIDAVDEDEAGLREVVGRRHDDVPHSPG